MATRTYESIKFENGVVNRISDSLTLEEALQINVNGTAFTITMRTPGDDIALVRGILHSEGIIKNKTFQPPITIENDSSKSLRIATVVIPETEIGDGYTNSRNLISVSSCGICGKTELEDFSKQNNEIDSDVVIEPNALHAMFEKMGNYQKAFKQSGGSHAAAAFDIQGNLICSFEDIGRHNAVDKVIGSLLLNQQLEKSSCLIVSGRISYEIVIKCFKARIPILAAVSAPSSLAVDYAKELGITLLAFCRESRATCYSNTQRIKHTNLANQAG